MFVKDIYQFAFARKKLWILPIMLLVGVIGFIFVFSAGSPLAPFIYTLF